MLKTEAEYKAKYMSILRGLGNISLVSGIIEEFCAKYAPQISPPSSFVVCNDYAEFAKKVDGNSDHPVNTAKFISAIYSTYFSPPSIFSLSPSIVSSDADGRWQRQGGYKIFDTELSFDEPAKIGTLIRNHNLKGVYTSDWFSGLAFDEMRKDYFNNVAFTEFHSMLCVLAENCFAFWQKDEDFVVCAKPSLSLDFRYRLHHDTRKAVTFPSGDGFYALRGVRVDEKYINEPISGKALMKERNAEVRMVLLEKYGSKLLDGVEHKIISRKGARTRLIEINWAG